MSASDVSVTILVIHNNKTWIHMDLNTTLAVENAMRSNKKVPKNRVV